MSINIQSVVCGALDENAWIVWAEGRDDCVVVDPGDEYPKLRQAIGDKRVGAILLTHGHFDHVMAVVPMAAEYGAMAYIGAEDVEMLNDAVLNGYTELIGEDCVNWPHINAQPFGEALSACGLSFTVLPTPGHSKGSVCLYLEDEGVLFSGDTLFKSGYGRMDLYGGNLSAMIRSLKELMKLPDGVRVHPGHGETTTIGEEKVRYRL